MAIRTRYEVVYYRQVLKHGTWDSEDCDWDWDETRKPFYYLEEAKKEFNKATPTASTPIIRLYEIQYDRYGDVASRLIDELV